MSLAGIDKLVSEHDWTSLDIVDNAKPQKEARQSQPTARRDGGQSRKNEFRYDINLAFPKIELNRLFSFNSLRLDGVIRRLTRQK